MVFAFKNLRLSREGSPLQFPSNVSRVRPIFVIISIFPIKTTKCRGVYLSPQSVDFNLIILVNTPQSVFALTQRNRGQKFISIYQYNHNCLLILTINMYMFLKAWFGPYLFDNLISNKKRIHMLSNLGNEFGYQADSSGNSFLKPKLILNKIKITYLYSESLFKLILWTV